MAHEAEIREDPASYVPRNVFGHFSRRTALTGVALGPVILALVGAGIVWDLPQPLIVAVVALVAGPVGGLALAPVHGLHAERWVPLALAERRAPLEMMWTHPGRRDLVGACGPATAERRARRSEDEASSGAFESALRAELEHGLREGL